MSLTEKYLTTADVAQRFQVDRKTVRRWVHHGQLEAIQWSARGWRYSETAVEAFAQSMAAPARREAS
jgi:excisionase family DNA binding protein